MRNKTILILLGYCIIIVGISFSSCKHDIILPDNYGYNGPCKCPADSIPVIIDNPCSTDTVYFRNVILPLIQSSCGIPNQNPGCHDASSGGENKPLISYNTIMQSGYVVRGSSSNSKMYKKLLETDPHDRMPPSPRSPLTQDQINLIKKWIDQGAKDNYCNSCDTTAFKFGADIWPIINISCTGCHSGASPAKGVLLTNYNQVNDIVKDGRLQNVLYAKNGYKQMPTGGKLNNCKLTKINKWIANGAQQD